MEMENPAVMRGASDLSQAAKLIGSEHNTAQATRQRLPSRRRSEIIEFPHENRRYRASISRFQDGRIGEVFLDVGRYGADLHLHAQDSAILCSLALQSGVPASVIQTAIRGPISRALAIFEEASA